MKIRHKITLWITAAGIIVSLAFSLVVFYEMTKQNYRQVDDELTATAENIFKIIKKSEAGRQDQAKLATEIFLDSRRYWIRVWRNDTLVYSSKMAQMIDLPLNFDKKRFSITVKFPRPEKIPGKKPYQKRTFRVRTAKIPSEIAPPGYQIYVALPLKKLMNELSEVLRFIVVGLSISTLLLVLLSYFLAGRILRPIRKITNLAQDIDENDLSRRIPLNQNPDELYDLSSAFNQMLDRLQYSFTRQKQLLADAAHELNTPLTSVHIFMEQSLCNPDLPAPFHQQLQQQQRVMQRIKRLLQDLMTLSRLEIGRKFKPESFNLKATATTVIEDFEPLLKEKNIALQSLTPETLNYFGDRALLRRLLINAISNAIKYNFQNGELNVTLEKSKGGVRLTITNTGEGKVTQ